MALRLEEIRALAERVAASHSLDVVDVEYLGGGGKHRTLRVFIEKNEAERARLRERVARLQAERAERRGLEGMEEGLEDGSVENDGPADHEEEAAEGDTSEAFADEDPGSEEEQDWQREADEAFLDGLPGVSNLEYLSGITHEDCEQFSRDFGTVLDVEELVPGTEYVLEVSSPGLDRRLTRPEDYQRFTGSLAKLQTFAAVNGNRHWQGRIACLRDGQVVLELAQKRDGKKAKKSVGATQFERVEIALSNVEKAQLVPEI